MRKSEFIHIGIMKTRSKTVLLLALIFVSASAVGYARTRQISVVRNAIIRLLAIVIHMPLSASFAKFSKENEPLLSVNAYKSISISGIMTKITLTAIYGNDRYPL